MEKGKIRHIFKGELSLIKDREVKNFVVRILNFIQDDFFSMPTSSTKKYHPDLCNEENGLMLHTKMVCHYANVLLGVTGADQKDKDIIIAACILHDIAKKAKYEKDSNDYQLHAEIASHIIDDVFMVEEEKIKVEKSQIALMKKVVSSHMGIFGNKPPKTIKGMSISEMILIFADYLATQKDQNHEQMMKAKLDYIRNEMKGQVGLFDNDGEEK